MPALPSRSLAPVLLAGALLALPRPAGAATLTVDDPLVSIAECSDSYDEEVDLSWDLGSSSGETVELLGSEASGCSEDSDTTTAVLVDGLGTSQTSYPQSGDAVITLADLLSAAGKTTTCDGPDFRVYVCLRLLDTSGSTVTTASAAVKFQLERPPAPTGVQATPGEGALYASWTKGTATTDAPAASKTYRAFARAAGVTHQSAEASGTSVRIGGLENGTTYDVWVVAYSEAGNESAASDLTAGTPQPVKDFFGLYQDAGGGERGGCAQGGAAGILALLATAWVLSRLGRARRAPRALPLLAALWLAAPAARADEPKPGNELWLRIQSYRPDVDSEVGGSGIHPYQMAFGARSMWGGRLEYARTLPVAGQTLGLGAGLGYLGVWGHGYTQDATTGAYVKSGDSTALHLVPLSAFVSWRLDALTDRWRSPIVPYARAALERYQWFTTGTSHASHGGGTNGYSVTLGAVLRLDAVDPESSRLLSQDGIRHTGLTFDVTRAWVNDFGSSRSWDLSTRGWALSGGLLVAF